jgi:hypothetical protein
VSQRQLRERLNRLAWLLDSSIPIPGTGLSIGLDALIGLFPVLGDLIGVALSSYIIKEAHALGVSRAILTRMAFNVAVEGLAGLVPLAGDLFDAGWKANQRNVQLLNDWLDHPQKARKSSRAFVVGLSLALVAFVLACAALTWLLLAWLAGWKPA